MILIADDDASTRALIRVYLKNQDYEFVEAVNGREAIESLTDEIDVVLLDLHMPEVSGMECLRYIQKHHKDIATIVVTASNDISNAINAMKNGAFDYVVKPLKRDALIALMGQAVKMARQAKHLKKVEAELKQAREQEISIASKIQQFLLKGQPTVNYNKIQIAQLAVASQKVDGDFFDIFNHCENSFDLIIGDVMGKGIPAALLGAAIKSHLMRVTNELIQSSSSRSIPDPQKIVTQLHAAMIDKLEELETFVTLCYSRFDMTKHELIFVDCGHMRTIHYQKGLKTTALLKGVNMPLGFPERKPFTQIVVPFSVSDIFLFYSDGLTEAKNPEGEFFGEARLVDYIKKASKKDVENLVYGIWKQVITFTQSEKLDDDFTSVVVEIKEEEKQDMPLPAAAELKIMSDLDELLKVRKFIGEFCKIIPSFLLTEEYVEKVEIAVNKVVANIINHAYGGRGGEPIEIEAKLSGNHIIIQLSYWGEEHSRELIMHNADNLNDDVHGTYVIADCIDEVDYMSDISGRNCASLKIKLSGDD